MKFATTTVASYLWFTNQSPQWLSQFYNNLTLNDNNNNNNNNNRTAPNYRSRQNEWKYKQLFNKNCKKLETVTDKIKFHKAYLFHILAGITISSALLLGEPPKVAVTSKKPRIFTVVLCPCLAKLGINIVATTCATHFCICLYKTIKVVVKSVENNTLLNETSFLIFVKTKKDNFGTKIFTVAFRPH